MNKTNKTIGRILSVALVLSLVLSMGICGMIPAKGEYEVSDHSVPWLSGGKAMLTSSGAFLQLYMSVEKGVKTGLQFFAATGFPIYGFESNAGGNVNSVKKNVHETNMQGSDGQYYSTWSSDKSYTPYQAFETDVSGISGDIILGFEGISENTEDTYIMQIFNPATGSYFDVCRQSPIQGTISLVCTTGAQDYAENGILRFRVTVPADAATKKINMKYASAGQIDESIQYGGDKSRTSSGNSSANIKGEFTKDMCFCGKATLGDDVVFSMVYSFATDNINQKQLARFNVNFDGDATANRNMTWSSTSKLDAAVVQMVPYGAMFPNFKDAAEYTGTVEKFSGEKPYSYYVNITGLEAGKEYWYRYGDGGDVWSDPCYLRTDDGDDHFAFIMGGDPQTQDSADIYAQVSRSVNESKRIADTEFLVVCGDESDMGSYEFCWDWYLDANQATFRSMTLAPTMGNHDSWGWDWWVRMHNLSDPSNPGKRGSYYSFEYGNAHFSVINGNISAANQKEAELKKELEWLRADLTNTDADFKFVISHQGMYSYPVHTYESDTVELRAILVPLFEECGVDMMLQGHDHVWLRTKQMKQGSVVNNANTITDVVSGKSITYLVNPDGITYCNGGSLTGSKYHDPNPTPFQSLFRVDCATEPHLPTFNIIEIDGGKLCFSGWAYGKDGVCRRVSEYTTYPSGQFNDDSYNIIKTSYYDKVNARINALPEEITLENAEEIDALAEICGAETETILSNYVPDYAKLQSAVAVLEELKAAARLGDFDDDGQITVADALAALRVSVKLTEETPEVLAIGDINKDGHITVADALAILRVAAKLAEHL